MPFVFRESRLKKNVLLNTDLERQYLENLVDETASW